MKIDVLKNIKSFMYVDGSDPLDLPYWYPAECTYAQATYLEYLKTIGSVNKYVYDVKPIINFSNTYISPSEYGYYTFKGYDENDGYDDYLLIKNTFQELPDDWSIIFNINSNNQSWVDFEFFLMTWGSGNFYLSNGVNGNFNRISISDPYDNGITVQSSFDLPTDDTWHSICVTYKKSTGVVTMYLDITLDTSLVGSLEAGYNWSWGEDQLAIMSCFGHSGKSLKNFKIYNGILSQTDVTNFYNEDFDSILLPTILEYDMNEEIPDGEPPYTEYTIDSSINGYDATPNVLTTDKDDFFHPETIGISVPDVSLYIGFANSQIIDNIELDVSGTFTTIELKYSMDDWTYHYENYSANPFDGLTNLYPVNPIYLNRALTTFNKSIEFKILKITFKSCASIVLNDIIIEKYEVINIPSDTLNEFVYTSFQNDILSIYKDTDIKDCIIKYQDMMIEENE